MSAQMLLHRSSRTSTPNGTAAIPPPAGAPPDLSSRLSSCCARSSATADVCGDRRARLEERDLLVDGGHGAGQIRKMRAFASAATRAIRSGLRHPSPALSTATYKSRGARDAAARPLPCAFHTYPPANMPQTAETASFKFNHTMLRVKDPKKSIAFYTETLGMELISELPQSGFTLYFLGYCDPSLSADERAASRFSREGPCLPAPALQRIRLRGSCTGVHDPRKRMRRRARAHAQPRH
jgi:hypothetical protein